MNVLFVAMNMVLGILIPLMIQLFDHGRLSPREREYAWNFASWGSAVYNFGPLSLLAWGYVTRSPRYWRGLVHGLFLTGLALLVQGILSELTGRAMGLRPGRLAEARMSFVATFGLAAVAVALIGAARSIYEAVRGLSPPRRARP